MNIRRKARHQSGLLFENLILVSPIIGKIQNANTNRQSAYAELCVFVDFDFLI